jgi:hypothetical protein
VLPLRRMSRIVSTLLLTVSALLLAGCAGTDYDGSSPAQVRPPTVALPTELNDNEAKYLPEVEDVLADAGYRTTLGRVADYALDLSLEDGPVNADSAIRLRRREEIVAAGEARVGGPRIIFQRARVVAESFRQALAQFENALPPARSTRPTWRDDSGYRAERNDPSAPPTDGRYRRSAPRYEDDYVPR